MAIQNKFIRALNELKTSMTSKDTTLGFLLRAIIAYPANHIDNKENPHEVTAEDVGLENTPNWPPATKVQAEEGENSSSLISPKRLDDYMDVNVYVPLTQIFDDATGRM